jgi:hypothetical protein
MNKVIELKKQGIAKEDVAQVFRNMHMVPPSAPTIRKYYAIPYGQEAGNAYAKDKVFDHEPYRHIIVDTLAANVRNKAFRISSLYDLLEEELVDSGKLPALPGNEQTLRNYCAYLRKTGQVPLPEERHRLYDFIEDPPAGQQAQLDYGEQATAVRGMMFLSVLCKEFFQ